LRGLCYYDAGSRSFYTSKKAIRTPEDLEGLKIRVMNNQMAINMVNSMGGSATPLAYGELYTAIQQGVVDGAENNPPSFVSSNHYEISSFTWTEEFARFSLIWLTILGAAYLNGTQEHLSMDFLYQKFSESNQRKASILIEVLVFLFALIVMVIGGLNLVYTTLHLEQLSGTLRIPLGYVYAIMPFSGFLIMCFSVYHISKILKNKINN